MDHLEESPLNLNMKHHFIFLFIIMDFKLLNYEICSQSQGLFVSAQWHQKVILASITPRFLLSAPTVLYSQRPLSHLILTAVLHMRKRKLGVELTPAVAQQPVVGGEGGSLTPDALPPWPGDQASWAFKADEASLLP